MPAIHPQIEHSRQLGPHHQADRHVLLHRAHGAAGRPSGAGVSHLPAQVWPHQHLGAQPSKCGLCRAGHQ